MMVNVGLVLYVLFQLCALECQMEGPRWDPAGSVPFLYKRTYGVVECHVGSHVSYVQSLVISLLTYRHSTFSLVRQPGMHTDPVTYILYVLGNRYENAEYECSMQSGSAVLNSQVLRSERMDHVFARDMARHEADQVGAGICNIHTLTMLMFKALGTTSQQVRDFLQPRGGIFPINQVQYD